MALRLVSASVDWALLVSSFLESPHELISSADKDSRKNKDFFMVGWRL